MVARTGNIRHNQLMLTFAKRFENIGVFLLLLGLGSAIYSNILRGEFVSDDFVTIVDNPAIRDLSWTGLFRAFDTRFLTGLSFALNYHTGGLEVSGYHIVNIICQVISAFAVYHLIRLTFLTPAMLSCALKDRSQNIALFTALIFLSHPAQTQGVSYITQRAVVMGTGFYVLSLLGYAQYRLTKQRLAKTAALLTMLLAFFTKEMTVTLIGAILLYEWIFFPFRKKDIPDLIKRLWPFILLTLLPLLVFRLDQSDSLLALKGQVASRSFSWLYFLTELQVLVTYLRLFLWPANQQYEYLYPLAKGLSQPAAIWAIGALAVLIAAAFLNRQKRPLISFGIFWFFLTTSVEVVVVSLANRAVIYEHWMFLSVIGLALLLTAGLNHFFTNPSTCRRVLTAGVIVLSLLSYNRNLVWQNETRFWDDGLQKSPRNPQVYLGLGTAYQRKKEFEKAKRIYRKALDHFHPDDATLTSIGQQLFARIFNNLGGISLEEGDLPTAIDHLKASIALHPHNAATYKNLGIALYLNGQPAEAIRMFDAALQYRQTDPAIYYYKGLCYLAGNEHPMAKENLSLAHALYLQTGHQMTADKIKTLLRDL
jgi:tetratricopeptide (TPR) repeat protein